MAFGMAATFNEPATDDPTSGQPGVGSSPTSVGVSALPNPIATLLGRKKKNPRSPAPLARAIAQSKRGYQSKRKFG